MNKITFDFLCLRRISEELQAIVGARIRDVFQYEEYSIILRFNFESGITVLVSCSPKFPCVFLSSKRYFKKHESVPIKRAQDLLRDFTVVDVRQKDYDRVLEIKLQRDGVKRKLVLFFFGTQSNVLIVDESESILFAFRKSSKYRIGSKYDIGDRSSTSLEEYLKAPKNLSPVLENELALITENDLVNRFNEGRNYLYEGLGVYPVMLESHKKSSVQIINSLSMGYELIYHNIQKEFLESDRREKVIKQLTQSLKRLNKKILTINQDNIKLQADIKLQPIAELFATSLSTVKKGDKQVVLTDYNGNLHNLEINPTLSPAENLSELFKRIKKSKNVFYSNETKLKLLLQEKKQIEGALDVLKSCDISELDTLVKQLGLEPKEETQKKKAFGAKKYEGYKVSELLSPSGKTVIFGRNAASNDYITKKVAKPNDYWFHVRGHSSSHVVLQTNNQPDKVQKEDILFAAKISALQSALKFGKHVPVDYTLAKYVRKPKKSPPGEVTYTNEKTVFIDNPQSRS